LEPTSFETNFKAVNKAYEDFVLNKGDFDERAFLSKYLIIADNLKL
jgi:hypothetical protein